MANKKREITPRRRKALIAIYDLKARFGGRQSPTLNEVGKELKVGTPQSVNDLIKKLEEHGFVKRERNIARSLTITPKGLMEIGRPTITLADDHGIDSGPRREQEQIADQLTEIDRSLGALYRGAKRALADQDNPDRIAQSAHSFRELGRGLASHLEAFYSIKKVKSSKNEDFMIKRLTNVWDPKGGAPLDETIYKIWNDSFHKEFAAISHHKPIELVEFNSLVSEFEKLLARYVLLPQSNAYQDLDQIISSGPDLADYKNLRALITKNYETYHYFFANIDERWFESLRKENLLNVSLEVGIYLERIVQYKAEPVVDFLLNTDFVTANTWIKSHVIKAFLNAGNASRLSEFVDKIKREKWIVLGDKNRHTTFFVSDLLQVFKKLIQDQQYDTAVRLAYIIFYIPKGNNISTEDAEGTVDEYYFNEGLDFLELVPAEKLSQFNQFLRQTLDAVLRSEFRDGYDFSSIWLSTLDGAGEKPLPDLKVVLTLNCKKYFTKYVKYLVESKYNDLQSAVAKLFGEQSKFSIFKRLELFVYCQFQQPFLANIEKALIDQYPEDQSFEYLLLLYKSFGSLSTAKQNELFNIVRNDNSKSRKIDFCQRIANYLPEDLLSFLSDKEAKLPEPFPYITSWSGPETPISQNDLGAMRIDEQINYFNEWKSNSNDHFSPSSLGLARTLAEVVREKTKDYSDAAHAFMNRSLKPVFIYQYFFGLEQGFRKGGEINWSNILSLCEDLFERRKIGQLVEPQKEDRHSVGWDDPFKSMASLLSIGLVDADRCPDKKLKKRIWDVLKIWCEYPDPTPEHEKSWLSDHDPYSLAINCTRGEGFIGLFHYILWLNRSPEGEKGPKEIPIEVKELLERHLVEIHDPSRAIRSVYGLFFHVIYLYDQNWGESLIKRIFPESNIEMRYAAWRMYMSQTMYPQVYTAMKPICRLFVDEFTNNKVPKLKYLNKMEDTFASHLMLAYAHGIDSDHDNLLGRFFESSPGNVRGLAISFAGRSFINGTVMRGKSPNLEILKKFWEKRLDATSDIEELRNFGWWAKTNYFDNEWLLKMLQKTITKTNGIIEGEFKVLEVFDQLASLDPKAVSESLHLMMKNRENLGRTVFVYKDKIRNIVSKLMSANDEHVSKIARAMINNIFLPLGLMDFRELLDYKIQ
jgi:DNA-binding MarR family transcriptional regulator